MIRIASGQGYWGDWQEAPHLQISSGPIDYLVMDYLAEITMSILQKQKSRNPELGYAKDFVPLMKKLLPDLVEKNITVIGNDNTTIGATGLASGENVRLINQLSLINQQFSMKEESTGFRQW